MNRQIVVSACLLAAAWTEAVAQREFAAMNGPTWSYCQARHPDPSKAFGCLESDFNPVCHATCSDGCDVSEATVLKPWTAVAGQRVLVADGGFNYIKSVYMNIEGERLSDQVFRLSGEYVQWFAGTSLELALVRYSGDPSALDGTQFISAYDLVGLGLIAPGDILFVSDLAATGSTPEGFSFDVDVMGVPDEHIAVLVGGEGIAANQHPYPLCVPASGPLGLLALTLALMIASYRRPRAA